jgi:2-oxoglutarate dehydrogenase E1 component
LPVEQLKAIIAQSKCRLRLGTRRTKEYGAYSYMLMNFDLVKWRLASLVCSTSRGKLYTRAKRRHADAIKWYLIKNLFR